MTRKLFPGETDFTVVIFQILQISKIFGYAFMEKKNQRHEVLFIFADVKS